MAGSMTVSQRLSSGFGFVVCLMIIIVVIAIRESSQLAQQTVGIVEQDWPKIGLVEGIAARTKDNALISQQLLLVEDRQPLIERIQQNRDRIATDVTDFESRIKRPEAIALLTKVKRLREKYLAAQDQLQVLLARDERDGAKATINNEVLPTQVEMIKLLDELFRFQGVILENDGKKAKALASETFNVLITLIVAGAIATLIISSLIIRSIVRPLGGEPADVAAIARHIAGGDLTTSITVKDGDRQSLLADMKSMQSNLRDTVQRLMDSSAQLAAASEEMSAVTEDTTRGLNQQHAELELAVTAVTEMTAAVDEVARNAVSTSESSRKSDMSAQRGREQVMRTVESIDHLTRDVTGTARQVENLADQVRDISKLLDVIRSIAEQTNLLALNAAIEAARAGDAGRGFAVVADEVRALAYRTQQSTQEIEQMIGGIRQHSDQAVASMRNSNERALAALDVARAAGSALEEITVEISGISERNLVIASASEQQVQVAREVDRNLVAIRDVSIQATAGAKQTSEASQSLAQLAIDLNAMISRFKL